MKVRVTLLSLLAGAAMALDPPSAPAQQKPIYGCNAAPSCRPLGFSSLNAQPGVSGVFFGVGMSFGPGYNIHLVTPRDVSYLLHRPARVPERELFHLHTSLLSPTAAAAPDQTPQPSPTPAPSAAAPRG